MCAIQSHTHTHNLIGRLCGKGVDTAQCNVHVYMCECGPVCMWTCVHVDMCACGPVGMVSLDIHSHEQMVCMLNRIIPSPCPNYKGFQCLCELCMYVFVCVHVYV